MAYSVQTLDGHVVVPVAVDGPLPQFGDEIVVEDAARFRVLGVVHRLGSHAQGECVAEAVVLVQRDDGESSLGAAMRRARRQ